MNCKITDQIFDVIKSLQEAQKQPKDYGTGQLLYHSEMAFLETVQGNPDLKTTELAQILNITKGAATQMVAKLSEKGLIEAYQLAGNRKEKFYRLTPEGELAQEGHVRFHEEANQNLCNYFCARSEEEIRVIMEFLEKLQACVPFCEFSCKNNNCSTERMKNNESKIIED